MNSTIFEITQKDMEKHAGSIVEKVVRRSGIGIAELARRMGVNRRSLYNWFEQPTLSFETIAKIGYLLGYDFTYDFPDFKPHQPVFDQKEVSYAARLPEDTVYWKNKYITLLEKYNQLLIKQGEYSKEHAA